MYNHEKTMKEMYDDALKDFNAGDYVDFFFQDNETGEAFFVEIRYTGVVEEAVNEAWKIANANFEAPTICGIYTDEDAEILGYDTY